MGWPEWIFVALLWIATITDFGVIAGWWERIKPPTDVELTARLFLRPIILGGLLWWGGFFA